MKTLIELYDERPIENFLGVEVFQPEHVIYLCPPEVAQQKAPRETIRRYLRHKNLSSEPVFMEVSMYNADKIIRQLEKIAEEYPECVLDVTGGTDAALFAAGSFCMKHDASAFTFSRKQQCFYNIHHADFANELPCAISHSIEDCFVMAGGSLREGRVDNAILEPYLDTFQPFFQVYLHHRRSWTGAIHWIQEASQTPSGSSLSLQVSASKVITLKNRKTLKAPMEMLRDLADIGYISELAEKGRKVSFVFRDAQVRFWLRDIGSVLELFVYLLFLRSGLFNDVHTSAIVDWEGDNRQENVTNEIDVMAMRGIVPVFVSCKTCSISTEALNELAILRDRFGGEMARAVIVSTQHCQAITRRRASELKIDVVDIKDLSEYCDGLEFSLN